MGQGISGGRSRKGLFQLKRKSRRDRCRAKLRAIQEELRRRLHEPIPQQEHWLCHVVRGYFAYRAVPTNVASLSGFRQLWWTSGDGPSSVAAKRTAPADAGSPLLRPTSCPPRVSFICGRMLASPSLTQGGSPVRKSRPPGSVRGVPGNGHPYRDTGRAWSPVVANGCY